MATDGSGLGEGKQAIRVRTTVLPGGRIELVSVKLVPGSEVDVVVAPARKTARRRRSVREIRESLPPIRHTTEEWDEIDRQFREERRSWDR